MAPNIYCCGAGTAADTEAVTGVFLNVEITAYLKPRLTLLAIILSILCFLTQVNDA